jgi:hypothetical protein
MRGRALESDLYISARKGNLVVTVRSANGSLPDLCCFQRVRVDIIIAQATADAMSKSLRCVTMLLLEQQTRSLQSLEFRLGFLYSRAPATILDDNGQNEIDVCCHSASQDSLLKQYKFDATKVLVVLLRLLAASAVSWQPRPCAKPFLPGKLEVWQHDSRMQAFFSLLPLLHYLGYLTHYTPLLNYAKLTYVSSLLRCGFFGFWSRSSLFSHCFTTSRARVSDFLRWPNHSSTVKLMRLL